MGTTTLTAQEIRLYVRSVGDTVYTADQKDHTVTRILYNRRKEMNKKER